MTSFQGPRAGGVLTTKKPEGMFWWEGTVTHLDDGAGCRLWAFIKTHRAVHKQGQLLLQADDTPITPSGKKYSRSDWLHENTCL